jgi:hypothetical protein
MFTDLSGTVKGELMKQNGTLSLCDEYLPIYTIRLVRDEQLIVRERPTFGYPAKVAEIVTRYLDGVDREHFVVMMTDVKHHLIGINTAHVGCLDRAVVRLADVFTPAVLMNVVGGDPGTQSPQRRGAPLAGGYSTDADDAAGGRCAGYPGAGSCDREP